MSDETDPPKRQRRKEDRPAEIIEAGLQEFAEKGFVGARLEDVAARAEISKGTIYLYFKNKEDLFEAAVRSRIVPVVDEIEGLVDRYDGTTRSLVEMFLQNVYQRSQQQDIRTIMRIILGEGHRFPRLVETYYQKSISPWRRLLEKIVRRGVERGEVRNGALAQVPLVITAPSLMAILWSMTFSAHDDIAMEDFHRAHLELLMNGLFTDEGSAVAEA